MLPLSDVWCAGCHPPVVRTAAVRLMGTQGEGAG